MSERICPGLSADWLNAWLAALGTTVLDSRIKLAWSEEPLPLAVLSAEGDQDPIDILIASWPDRQRIVGMPLASELDGIEESVPRMERRVSVGTFAHRVRAVRSHSDTWTLSSTMTDLQVDENGDVAHAPLDPPGPGTIKWLHHRLEKVCEHIGEPSDWLPPSLAGKGIRVVDNGLGFDLTRVTTLADHSSKTVDPVIEVLAFFGLAFFPVRGQCVDLRMSRNQAIRVRQRGFLTQLDEQFAWPVWRHSIDRWGIDALFDIWHKNGRNYRKNDRLGVFTGWKMLRARPRGSADRTAAYGSVRM